MNTQYLSITWSVSRGRDTYGYNICKLTPSNNPCNAYKTCGGGYDMRGTVLGQWLQDNYQERLMALADRAHASWHPEERYKTKTSDGTLQGRNEGIYGMTYHKPHKVQVRKGSSKMRDVPGRVSLDGACGVSCMEDIAALIGVSLSTTGNRKGHVTGYMVTDYGSAEALKAAQK